MGNLPIMVVEVIMGFCDWLKDLLGLKPSTVEPCDYEIPEPVIPTPEPEPIPDPIPDPIPEPEPVPPPDPEFDGSEDIITDPIDPPYKPRKYALLVGINNMAEPGSELSGCINDVTNMRDTLHYTFGFDTGNILTLTDETATQGNILKGLEDMISMAKEGDELVFHYSGHGSQVLDANGDELNDWLDEILCPYDMDWSDPLTDDILASIFKKLPEGANLTFICDACNSGTMTRDLRNTKNRRKFLQPPAHIMNRISKPNMPIKKIGMTGRSQSKLNHVLLSGCRDDQSSADAYIDGQYQGALSYSVITAIGFDPDRNWINVHQEVCQILTNYGFDQEPQLSGRDSLISDRNIFGGR